MQLIHWTADGHRTACGQTAGLNCIGAPDSFADVTCPDCKATRRARHLAVVARAKAGAERADTIRKAMKAAAQ